MVTMIDTVSGPIRESKSGARPDPVDKPVTGGKGGKAAAKSAGKPASDRKREPSTSVSPFKLTDLTPGGSLSVMLGTTVHEPRPAQPYAEHGRVFLSKQERLARSIAGELTLGEPRPKASYVPPRTSPGTGGKSTAALTSYGGVARIRPENVPPTPVSWATPLGEYEKAMSASRKRVVRTGPGRLVTCHDDLVQPLRAFGFDVAWSYRGYYVFTECAGLPECRHPAHDANVFGSDGKSSAALNRLGLTPASLPVPTSEFVTQADLVDAATERLAALDAEDAATDGGGFPGPILGPAKGRAQGGGEAFAERTAGGLHVPTGTVAERETAHGAAVVPITAASGVRRTALTRPWRLVRRLHRHPAAQAVQRHLELL